LSKLTRRQKEELKSLVVDCKIRKLTAKEISALVLEKLGFSISVDHIKRLTANLKRDCARELLLLQKDREYYLQRMFFDRVDELQYQQKVLHEIIDNNKESSPDIVVRAVNALHAITINMNRLFQGLPVASFYIPDSATPTADTATDAIISLDSNIVQQRLERERKQLDWKDDPTFAGMPGHNLDENYNHRSKNSDEGDQP
jgi:hypothetical protein